MAPYFKKRGSFDVKAINFLDMAHSDGWNCLYSWTQETQLVQTVAYTIIQNTSGPKEADDFWSRAELNLLMALIHYVCNLKDANGNLLPIEQRSLGDVTSSWPTRVSMRSTASWPSFLRTIRPKGAPRPVPEGAGKPVGATSPLDWATGWRSFKTRWWTRSPATTMWTCCCPGKSPAPISSSSPPRTVPTAFELPCSSPWPFRASPTTPGSTRQNGRLPVLVNFCLDEFCNIGYMEGISDVFNSVRGFNMSCQIVVQSLSQWAEKYPGRDWENQLNTPLTLTLYMGCNDLTSAKYIAEKCGKVTIAVTNNQIPLQPLFSPVYSSTRSYSQTKSNTSGISCSSTKCCAWSGAVHRPVQSPKAGYAL